jgi:fimbrial chaperone protein
VVNTSSLPFLIQSWVDSFRGQGGWENTAPLPQGSFVVTPPLFRLDKGENSVLIQRAGGILPADRESVFSLNVKSIPQTTKPDPKSNHIQFAFVSSIKLFWRPAGLSGSPTEAYRQLTFKRAGDRLEAINPTPYHITIKNLSIGGRAITNPDNRMVPPLASQTWPIPVGASGKVSYSTITDFGGLTPQVDKPLQTIN